MRPCKATGPIIFGDEELRPWLRPCVATCTRGCVATALARSNDRRAQLQVGPDATSGSGHGTGSRHLLDVERRSRRRRLAGAPTSGHGTYTRLGRRTFRLGVGVPFASAFLPPAARVLGHHVLRLRRRRWRRRRRAGGAVAVVGTAAVVVALMPATVCVAIPGTTIVSSAAAAAPGVSSAAAAAPGVISVMSSAAAAALLVVSSTAGAALLVVSSAAALLVVSSTAAAALLVVSSAAPLLVVRSFAAAALLVVSSAAALLVVSSAAAAVLLVLRSAVARGLSSAWSWVATPASISVVVVVVVAPVFDHLRSSSVPDRRGGGSVAIKCKPRHIRYPDDEALLMFPLRLVPLHNGEAAMHPVDCHGCAAARPRSLPCEPNECTLWQVNCYLRQNGYRIEYCLSHGLKTYQAHHRGPTHKDFLKK
jgi:hypothetical protein